VVSQEEEEEEEEGILLQQLLLQIQINHDIPRRIFVPILNRYVLVHKVVKCDG
jgi:hypothetical protein